MKHPNTIQQSSRGISSDAGRPSVNNPRPSSRREREKSKCHPGSSSLTDNPPEHSSLSIPGRENDEAQVKALFGEWLDLRRRSLAIAIKLGRILTDLKAELKTAKPRRFWEPYVRDHLGIHPRTASNYLRIWREASDLDKLGKNLESETISDMGIREVLDLLADARKEQNDVDPSENSQSLYKDKSESPGKLEDPPIDLADGSRLDIKGIRWKDGLISREALESWMGGIVLDSEDSREQKLTARRQRAVIHIAAGINRACGTADPSSAVKLVESSFGDILAMLREKSSTN